MAVFLVLAANDDARLAAAIEREFARDNFKITQGQFLVYGSRLTTQDVSKRLGLSAGAVGNVLISRVTTYHGWHSRRLWEWLAAKMSPPNPADDTQSEQGSE